MMAFRCVETVFGDLIRHQILAVWPKADVFVYQLGFDALTSIQDRVPHLFLTGLKIEDMDGLEHLEPFIDKPMPILIVTSRPDARAFKMLQEVRYDGIYDGSAEGLENLPVALAQVIDRRPYVSPSMVTRLKRPRRVTLDSLTEREQVVLAVIGDGSDDQAAADRLRMSPFGSPLRCASGLRRPRTSRSVADDLFLSILGEVIEDRFLSDRIASFSHFLHGPLCSPEVKTPAVKHSVGPVVVQVFAVKLTKHCDGHHAIQDARVVRKIAAVAKADKREDGLRQKGSSEADDILTQTLDGVALSLLQLALFQPEVIRPLVLLFSNQNR